MSEHLLWLMEPGQSLDAALDQALARYGEKFGGQPAMIVLPTGTEHTKTLKGCRVGTCPTCLALHIQLHRRNGWPETKSR